MDLNWIKDRIIQFAISRLREIMLDGIDEVIVVIEDNRVDAYLAQIKRPEIRMMLELLIEIVAKTLRESKRNQSVVAPIVSEAPQDSQNPIQYEL